MDVLQYALDMELDGERYYRGQAEKYADTPLKRVFDTLAKDEAKHADIVRGRMDGAAYELKANENLANRENLFSGMKDYKPLVKDNPDQAALYHEALELEQKEYRFIYRSACQDDRCANFSDARFPDWGRKHALSDFGRCIPLCKPPQRMGGIC